MGLTTAMIFGAGEQQDRGDRVAHRQGGQDHPGRWHDLHLLQGAGHVRGVLARGGGQAGAGQVARRGRQEEGYAATSSEYAWVLSTLDTCTTAYINLGSTLCYMGSMIHLCI